MGDDKTLWDGNSNSSDPPSLRRPLPKSSQVNGSNINHSTLQERRSIPDLSDSFDISIMTQEDIISKSCLSVNAKEWFPPNYNKNNMTITNAHSVQGRLQKYRHSSDSQPLEITNNDSVNNDILQSEEDDYGESLQQLDELMSSLIMDPGHFDDLLDTFIATLGPYYDDVSFVSYIVESIVEKVLTEPNFRYSAVRLCVVIEDGCPLFRSTLCLLCQKKVKDKNDYNLTLLLAELYVQLNYENIYGGLVISSLEGILANGEGNNVKSACQVLKLTGASLEKTHLEAINNIFKQLVASREKQLLSIKNLIDSVLTLRASNWGQTEINLSINNSGETETVHDGAVLYGPDGRELTDEEQQFLDDNCSPSSDIFTEDPYHDVCWDPEMTEEMRAAYAEFVNLEN